MIPSAAPSATSSARVGAAAAAPSGSVRVAYPEQPSAFHPALTEEAAAVDWAALWGLPLYHLDPHGQLRPALLDHADTEVSDEGRFHVTLHLRAGEWSDGAPVVAGDVVATLEAMRAVDAGLVGPLAEASAVDDHTARLTYERPYARWPYVLAGGFSVLPAHVLSEGGIESWRSGVPVSGGPFRVTAWEPGLRLVLEAHEASPLGAPGVAELALYVTPDFESALGLLRDRRVDVVAGYLSPNPTGRASRLDEVVVEEAPLGGTWTSIGWREGGAVDGPDEVEDRARLRAALDLSEFVEGLLRETGDAATSTIPGEQGPWESRVGEVALGDIGTLTLVGANAPELVGLGMRAVQRAAQINGGDFELLRLEPDEVPAWTSGDATFVVRRDVPRPALAADAPPGATDELRALLDAADAAETVDGAEADAAQGALFTDGHQLPLFRVAPAHTWREGLLGVRPSSWPGLALWSAGEWRWDGAPPEQVGTVVETPAPR